jgi:hypothetical protein
VIGGAPETLLDTYEEERRPIAAGMLGLATRLLGEAREGTMRRDREARQLDLGYRASSLSRPSRCLETRLQPGDRAPDAPCRGGAGQPTRLFTAFAGPHWTLLGFDTVERPAARTGLRIAVVGEQGDLVDEHGHIAGAYGLAAGQWVLVRPDGYLAAITDTADLEQTLQAFF